MSVRMIRTVSEPWQMPRAFYGRMLLALSMIGFGVQYAIYGHLAAGLPPFPPFLPNGSLVAIFGAIWLVGIGCVLLTPIHLHETSLCLAIPLLLAALLHLVHLQAVMHSGDARTAFLEPLALAAGGFVLFSLTLHPKHFYVFMGARILFAFTMVIFGLQHFLYTQDIAGLLPSYFNFASYWVLGTGVAFMAVGAAIITGFMARPATLALAMMFFLWLVILHVPRLSGNPRNGDEWSSLLVTIGMIGASLLMSTSPLLPNLKRDLGHE